MSENYQPKQLTDPATGTLRRQPLSHPPPKPFHRDGTLDLYVRISKIVSQAQYRFFQKRLMHMHERDLDRDPETGIDRHTIVQGLQAVDFARLPKKSGQPAPTASQPKAPAPKIEAIKIGKRVACYLVRKPGPVLFVTSMKIYDVLKAQLPTLTRGQVFTLKAARSLMELEGYKVRSLKEAAELWASESPPEPALPVSPPSLEDDSFAWDTDRFGFRP